MYIIQKFLNSQNSWKNVKTFKKLESAKHSLWSKVGVKGPGYRIIQVTHIVNRNDYVNLECVLPSGRYERGLSVFFMAKDPFDYNGRLKRAQIK